MVTLHFGNYNAHRDNCITRSTYTLPIYGRNRCRSLYSVDLYSPDSSPDPLHDYGIQRNECQVLVCTSMFSHSTHLSSVVDLRWINGVILSAYVGALVQLGLALWSVGDCIQIFFEADSRYDIFAGRSQDVVLTSIYDGGLVY